MDLYHDSDPETHISGLAPADLHVSAMLESHVLPSLWIGITNDPDRTRSRDPRSYLETWAIIGGTTLRQLVEDLRKYYEHYDRTHRKDGAR